MLGSILLALGLAAQEPTKIPGPIMLVIEQGDDGVVYTCNGRRIDSRRVLTGVEAELRRDRPGETPVFVLIDEALPLSNVYEIGSLLVGKAGLKHVRYFVFSRKAGVMMELSLSWDRLKLSLDGKLEKKPW